MNTVERINTELSDLFAKQAKAYEEIGDKAPSAEQKEAISKINADISKLNDEKSFAVERDSQEKARQEFEASQKATGRAPQDGGPPTEQAQAKDMISAVLGNKNMKEFMAEAGANKLKSFSIPFAKSLVTGLSDTSAGALVVTDRKPIVDMGSVMSAISVLDLIPVDTTDSDTIDWVQITGFTNNAAETAEAEADGTPDGEYPESAITTVVKTSLVQDVGHWIPVTERALEDAGQMQGILRRLLGYGVRSRLASQVIAGNGTAPNLRGITSTSGIQSQAFVTDLLVSLRKGITKVQLNAGDALPTAFLMNPTDHETLSLMQDGEDRYIFGGPNRAGVPTVWGLPVAVDSRVTAETAYVADWNLCNLWVRRDVTIRSFEQDSDNARKRLVTLRADMRAAFGLIRPAAFVEIATVAS